MKGRLLINKMQWQISNPLSVLNCCLYFDRSFINIVTGPSQINLLLTLCLSYLRKFIVQAQRNFIDLRAR